MLIKVRRLDDEERSQRRCVVCAAPAQYEEHMRSAPGSNFFHNMCRVHVVKNASVPPESRVRILPVELR